MNIPRVEQDNRAAAAPAGAPAASDTIRESLLMQCQTGTVSAVEYLKSNGVSSAIIRCVLSKTLDVPEAGRPSRVRLP